MEKGKLLLVDDNLDMLLIGQRIFTKAGYHFISARTGQEGLEKVKSEIPDIIVLDYILPDINGTEFIKSIATEDDFQDIKPIPIIMLTARAKYIEDLDNCFGMNLKAYLNKPFGHRELVNVVDNILRIDKVEKRAQEVAENPEQINVKQSFSVPDSIDPDWLEDMKIASNAISSLCSELTSEENDNLTDQQRLDIQAVYRSSLNLIKLINHKTPQSDNVPSDSAL